MVKKNIDEMLKLKIIGIFVILGTSLLGVILPLYIGKKISPKVMRQHYAFRMLRCFSGGVMLGVAFIHMLAEAAEALASVCPEYPALAYTLTTVGAMTVLGLENISIYMMSEANKYKENNKKTSGNNTNQHSSLDSSNTVFDHDHSHDHAHIHEHYEKIEQQQQQQINLQDLKASPHHHEENGSHGHDHHGGCEHTHAIDLVIDEDSLYLLIKAYFMEFSIALHSVIIGLSMGAMAPGSESELQALIIAICFHQFFEGISLGTVLSSSSEKLGFLKLFIFVITFIITVPLGIIGGLSISWDNIEPGSPQDIRQIYTTGILASIAAGCLIYIALVEMIAEDFSSVMKRGNKGSELLKAGMFASLCLGNAFMAILAIWA